MFSGPAHSRLSIPSGDPLGICLLFRISAALLTPLLTPLHPAVPNSVPRTKDSTQPSFTHLERPAQIARLHLHKWHVPQVFREHLGLVAPLLVERRVDLALDDPLLVAADVSKRYRWGE